jgi:hypothetical protein
MVPSFVFKSTAVFSEPPTRSRYMGRKAIYVPSIRVNEKARQENNL